MLENCLLLSNSVDFSIELPHKCDRHIGHEEENIDGRPGSLAIQVGRIRQGVRSRALKQYGAVGEEASRLIVPLFNGNNSVFLALLYSAIFE